LINSLINFLNTLGSYFLGRTLIETPFFLLAPTLYCFMVYWICGFNDNDASNFWIFLFVCLGIYVIGFSMGLMAGTIFNNPNTAVSVIPVNFFKK
jgi:ATP-binding cassette, subfamily G (WHITE), eye pigment precursor transporter